jgi:hypothetical protein
VLSLLLVFLLVVLAIWLWFFFGSRWHCPGCGLELPGSFGFPYSPGDYCPRCGWRREAAR